MIMNILIGLITAGLISAAAYRIEALNLSGALAATLLGTVVFGLGGLEWAVLLITFFVTSSALSIQFGGKRNDLDQKFSKTSRRDAWQVLANGGLAGLFVILHFMLPQSVLPWLAFVGALAAANADTWATELGVLSSRTPRLITTGKPVEMGTSGGITLAGTLAALGGSALIALSAVVFWPEDLYGTAAPGLAALAVVLGGLLGSLVDSLLGATLQGIYFCPTCQKETERHPLHTCGSNTRRVRGWNWLNNDWVNGLCSFSGAGAAVLIAALLPGVLTQDTGVLSMNTFPMSSPAFASGQPIPARYTCSGENLSPALQWSGLPDGTKSLALIVDDPDAPVGVFVHWVVYNMDPTLTGLPEGVQQGALVKGIGTQGKNDYHDNGYDGPCPPAGKAHRYYFKLYALDLQPTLANDLNKAALMKAIQGHVLAEAQWMGTFQR